MTWCWQGPGDAERVAPGVLGGQAEPEVGQHGGGGGGLGGVHLGQGG